jgi:hypothetical protein
MILEVEPNIEFIFNNKKKAYLKRKDNKMKDDMSDMKGFGSKT